MQHPTNIRPDAFSDVVERAVVPLRMSRLSPESLRRRFRHERHQAQRQNDAVHRRRRPWIRLRSHSCITPTSTTSFRASAEDDFRSEIEACEWNFHGDRFSLAESEVRNFPEPRRGLRMRERRLFCCCRLACVGPTIKPIGLYWACWV